MIKCPCLFSLPRNLRYIAVLKRSTLRASIRLFYNNRQVALNVDDFKRAICRVFLGSEEKQGNKIGIIT